ncbi:hypothetical protein QUB19_10945 [Microcoleus sp. B4-C5]|jgi:hypothetical protein
MLNHILLAVKAERFSNSPGRTRTKETGFFTLGAGCNEVFL